ncbi:AraC family transcriptional regulator [uncultured Aureimonas sp.]|uniref:AraC family transcriptional regulator n=1 Tax=uncultured Aureimonas sp. TaxID=1604662 RepID=UPI0025E8526B|nr:AraC family transcriptional regulator [uncultured Aureimonas sp.]
MSVTISLELRRYESEVIKHSHAFHQIVLPYKGRLDMELNGQAGLITGSVGSFIAAGCDHSFAGRNGSACIVLDISTTWTSDSFGMETLPAFFVIGPDIRGLVDYAAFQNLGDTTQRLRTAWSELLLARLAQQRVVVPGPAQQMVDRAVAFMRDRLAQSIRVRDVARAAGTSPSRLHDAFVQQLGTTPHAYLIALRLDAAERLLADPSLSIAEVAVRSGHADQSALGRVMRRERDVTPAMLRCLLRNSAGESAQTSGE